MQSMISADELRRKYLAFFEQKGHTVISGAPLIPENDPTVLFTTAGMHPLVPYFMGTRHPAGNRLTDVQKCIRTSDIDEVGDTSHLTFFEMLGNWSLGDYFKEDAIRWSWEFLTSPQWLGLNPERLAFSVFAGDETAPRDEEAAGIWRDCGVEAERIFYLPRENNWWGPAGQTGPCGPDTEMFIITDKEPCGPDCSPACDCGRYLEIWNNVFMEYNKTAEGAYQPLAQKNVDTGMGLERTIGVLQGVPSVYETDLMKPIVDLVCAMSGKAYGADEETDRAMRIVSDHIRSATFLLGDQRGVAPSNVDQGYVLRRLIRRAIRFGGQLGMPEGFPGKIADFVIDKYKDIYPELEEKRAFAIEELDREEQRFQRTLAQGIKEFEKLIVNMAKGNATVIGGKKAFRLYDTYGFPVEMTKELAKERGLTVDMDGFAEAFKKHQETSGSGAQQRFGGGLADHSKATANLHTATHLLHAGLRKFLGEEVAQRGSNITAERMRFDFNFPRPMSAEEIAAVEAYVNEAISAEVPVRCEELTVEQARESGAIGLFGNKYGELVKVYSIDGYSKEICGGPHAENTKDLGRFKIQKEQSSSAGVRRIRAVLEYTDPK